jgi:hypothetical protein
VEEEEGYSGATISMNIEISRLFLAHPVQRVVLSEAAPDHRAAGSIRAERGAGVFVDEDFAGLALQGSVHLLEQAEHPRLDGQRVVVAFAEVEDHFRPQVPDRWRAELAVRKAADAKDDQGGLVLGGNVVPVHVAAGLERVGRQPGETGEPRQQRSLNRLEIDRHQPASSTAPKRAA